MLNIDMIAKVAVGVGVAIAGAFIVKKVTEKKKTYIDVNTSTVVDDDCDGERSAEEMQAEAAEKVSNALTWVNDHEKEFKGFCTALAAASAMISLVNGIRQFGMKNKILKNLEDLNKTKEYMYKWGYNEALRETEKHLRDAIADKNNPIFEILDSDESTLLKVKVEAA